MKLKMLAILSLASLMVFTGCSSSADANTTETEVTAPAETETETETEEEAVEGEVRLGEYETEKGDIYTAEVTFVDGEPVSVKLDTLTENGPKTELSRAGEYIMNADAEYLWHEQAELIEAELEGNGFDTTIDAVSGVSMGIENFLAAVEVAIAGGVVEGEVRVGEVETEKGDIYTAEVTFVDGEPVSVKLDTLTENGPKTELSRAGEYIMNADAEYLWHEQAELIEAELEGNGFDTTIDAVSGVSMGIETFLEAVDAALEQ